MGGFVLVDDKYWIEIEDLKANGLKLVTWLQFAKEKGSGWYAKDPGLNLRKGASTQHEIIATLKGDLFDIKPLQETEGLWCKVEVTEYRAHPCSGGKDLIIRVLVGWVKLISDDLTLNVYNYSRGC